MKRKECQYLRHSEDEWEEDVRVDIDVHDGGKFIDREQRGEAMQIVLTRLQHKYFGNDHRLCPFGTEELRERSKILPSRIANGKDAIRKPRNAKRSKMCIEKRNTLGKNKNWF
jgi:hypothetical protein